MTDQPTAPPVTAAELRERLELYRAKYTTPTILLHLFDDAFAALTASEQRESDLRDELRYAGEWRDKFAGEVAAARALLQRVDDAELHAMGVGLSFDVKVFVSHPDCAADAFVARVRAEERARIVALLRQKALDEIPGDKSATRFRTSALRFFADELAEEPK